MSYFLWSWAAFLHVSGSAPAQPAAPPSHPTLCIFLEVPPRPPSIWKALKAGVGAHSPGDSGLAFQWLNFPSAGGGQGVRAEKRVVERKCGMSELAGCSERQASLGGEWKGDPLDSENPRICLGCSRGMEFMTSARPARGRVDSSRFRLPYTSAPWRPQRLSRPPSLRSDFSPVRPLSSLDCPLAHTPEHSSALSPCVRGAPWLMLSTFMIQRLGGGLSFYFFFFLFSYTKYSLLVNDSSHTKIYSKLRLLLRHFVQIC